MLLPKTVQFSVKSLLILVGCAAVVFGIVHHELRLRSATNWALRSPNVDEVYDATLFDYENRLDRNLLWFHRLAGSRILAGIRIRVKCGEDVASISRCKYLRYLELRRSGEECDVNAVLTEVARCRRVCELGLRGFQIDDFSVLKSMDSLDTLDVRGTKSNNWGSIAQLQNLELVITSAPDWGDEVEAQRETVERYSALVRLLPNIRVVATSGRFLSGHLTEEDPRIPRRWY